MMVLQQLFKFKTRSIFFLILGVFGTLTLLIYGVIHFVSNDEPIYFSLLNSLVRQDKIKTLMQQTEVKYVDPISSMYLSRDGSLMFYHLPVIRRSSVTQFTEITSANRDTSYPLAPDFTFHLDYSQSSVVLYEAYNPGCVYRLYLFPVLPTEVTDLHKITASNLRDTYLRLDVDGETFEYTLAQLLEGKEYPFLYPISATHKFPSSGIGSYLPICYQKHMKITYIANVELPRQLLHTTVNCSRYDLRCPVHIYSGISRTTFPVGTQVNSFKSTENSITKNWRHQTLVAGLAESLKSPELNGPDKYDNCVLECRPICAGCKRIVYQQSPGSGTISAIKMRVFKMEYGQPVLLEDWRDILITMSFDDVGLGGPQVNKVPLGSLFGVTGSLNDFSGAAMGHKKKTCSYAKNSEALHNLEDSEQHFTVNLPADAVTGYFYFPLPYWKSAKIEIEGTKYVSDDTIVCNQFDHVEHYYDERSTGHFHAEKTYYTGDVSGWRNMLSLNNFQGHIVAVLMDVDNLRAVRNVPLNERFATLQADPVLFVDGRKEAAMLGTGLEDYFSYAHGFALAENTTYAFVGNYHAAPKRSEPLTWHTYRLHLFDPIPLHSSVHFVMEGTSRDAFHKPVKSIPYFQYKKLLSNEKMGLSHTIFYYGKETESNFFLMDSIQFGDVESEKNHSFVFENSPSSESRPTFSIYDKKFLGQCTNNKNYTRNGRVFKYGDKMSFQLTYNRSYSHILLRREFHSPPFVWKQRAKLWVNDVFHGLWFIPMGTVTEEFSLRQDDIIINGDFNTSSQDDNDKLCDTEDCDSSVNGTETVTSVKVEQELGVVNIEIEVETEWRDIAYYLYSFNKRV